MNPSAPYPDSDTNNNHENYNENPNVELDKSIHSSHITEIHQMPMNIIQRPIVPVLDPNKVQSLMQTFKENPDSIPPIDVMWIQGHQHRGLANDNPNNYYFSFGGCHRFEAAKQLSLPTIKAKLFKSTIDDLRFYLGSSTPDLK